jgi:alpha-L-fucosidase 2
VSGASEAWLTWVGGTNYDMDAGDAAHGFSFAGADPHDALVSLLDSATSGAAYAPARAAHTADFAAVTGKFALSLGAWGAQQLGTPTDELRAAYAVDAGNPYVEWLAFNLGRYMLAASARGALPANLQGKWANSYSSAWSAGACCPPRLPFGGSLLTAGMRFLQITVGFFAGDGGAPAVMTCYILDANINVQMNYWAAEMTNLDVTQSLWDYMEVKPLRLVV